MNFLIEWKGASPVNYAAGRQGHAVTGIVDHWIGEGTLDSAVAYFATPRPLNPTSAHYVVGRDGRIVQCVGELDTAYAAGVWDVNLSTISIEHELTPDLPDTDLLYEASAWLHARLASQFGFALVYGTTVRRHSDIVQTTCPGTLHVERIINQATEEEMTEAEVEAIVRKVLTDDGYPNFVDAVNKRLAIDAHHTHATSEPTA